ncbi:MAG: phosphoenolpyruvate--protein phosphotransferase, partial [Solirubrobacterales bacterium]|nr:phosphoenolpyruvate--protein phosphotransferase [Solirubrobacterales bacterium]
MVGIVVVSHSETLAEGVVTLAREMGGEELALEAAGGTEEPGALGTDAERVRAAIERARSEDGVLVLMDLGSALMSAEMAIELLADASVPVRLSEAPLVEGTVAAAVAARGGGTLEEVEAEARGALAMKASQLGAEPSGSAQPERPPSRAPATAPPDAEAELEVRNEVGLHARPAARFVALLRGLDAEVLVSKRGGGGPVGARSLTNLVSLGVRRGDTLQVSASGPEARRAIDSLRELAEQGFGDGLADGPPPGRAAGAPVRAAAEGADRPSTEEDPPSAGESLTGVAASPGIAWAPAYVLHARATLPAAAPAGTPGEEHERLHEALTQARRALQRDREAISARAGAAEAEIFDAHLALLDDEALLDPAEQAIADGVSAERAWHEAAEQVAERYRALEQPLLAQRATDVLDVGRRVVQALGAGQGQAPQRECILIADELTPADAAALDPALVLGIATAHGAATAHAAILARSLGLPAVVGLGDRVLAIAPGTPLLLDGDQGSLQVQPPKQVVDEARGRERRARARRAAARERVGELATTRDGQRVEVFANLGSTGEGAHAVELGAEGVGLLRTEFLYLERSELPGEEEQVHALSQLAAALEGRPLIVRTLDAGADKPLPAVPMAPERNPFLGVRGIRLSLEREDLLATQLRAILRVAREHPVKAMLPMVTTVDEILRARALLDLAREQTGITAPLELGIMIEVPAAALTSARLGEHADFFSVGTNDLTQYTMAAERGNERLAPLLSGPHPAVLRLIEATVSGARARGRTVGVCGELAGDP